MRNAFLVAILLGIVSGCAAPKIYELNSTTWMVTYKYATSYDAGLDEAKKAAEIHCKQYGKHAEVESVLPVNEFTTAATLYCKKSSN